MRLQNIKKWLSDKVAAHSILDLRKYQKLITHWMLASRLVAFWL
ncbi:hypothetical protein HanPSC8_Chr05g0217431 [Helianthus annuus]|nr:hypothetical protein HanPSC8_Chr05g0217431 [Helianthus annuus]